MFRKPLKHSVDDLQIGTLKILFSKLFLPKAVTTLAFYLIFILKILKRAYVQLPSIYTCFHLVIPRTKSSVNVNNNNFLCMKEERWASRKKPVHADSKIEKKIFAQGRT